MNKHLIDSNGATDFAAAMTTQFGQREFSKGQVVFNSKREPGQPYWVASGEVIILRDGTMIDIVEAGEYLHPAIWQQATAIAWTNCRLVGMG